MYSEETIKTHIEKLYADTEKAFAMVRSQAPHPGMFDSLSVECYGSYSILPHVATVTLRPPATLLVTPWDKTIIKNIEQAIAKSFEFASVSSDGEDVIVSFPPLTTEQKEEIAKKVGEKHEEARIAVKLLREKTMKHLEKQKKDNEISENELYSKKENVEKEIKKAQEKLKEMTEHKKQNILS